MGAKGGYKDLTNQIFGDFKAIEFDNSKGKYKYYWICECVNCGNKEIHAIGYYNKNSEYKMCKECKKAEAVRVRREAEKKYFGEYNREENINEVI